ADRGVLLEDSDLQTTSFGTGRGGDIVVEGSEIRLVAESGNWAQQTSLGSTIDSASYGEGDAGRIRLRTPGPLTMNGLSVVNASAFVGGCGGQVEVEAASLLLRGSE